MAKKVILLSCLLFSAFTCFCWGFYAHKKINQYAVYLLPPQMLTLYKSNMDFMIDHSVDPDKRRYAVAAEGARHFMDLDHYGDYPFGELPRKWDQAVVKFGKDTLQAHGMVAWHIPIMFGRLTKAFKEKNFSAILKNSADIGHYIADAHVPLHATSNYNGQQTDQKGIHAFWESRIPELYADKDFDFLIGKALYLKNPEEFIWNRLLESALAADSVLKMEKILSAQFPSDKKYAFEKRNNIVIRQYSSEYANAFNKKLNGMIERRMRESIFAVASFWFTAWVNAGQPDLTQLSNATFAESDLKEFKKLDEDWRKIETGDREHE